MSKEVKMQNVEDEVQMEFSVSDDFTEWNIYIFSESPLHTEEFCKALHKFATAYAKGEIMAPSHSGAESEDCMQ